MNHQQKKFSIFSCRGNDSLCISEPDRKDQLWEGTCYTASVWLHSRYKAHRLEAPKSTTAGGRSVWTRTPYNWGRHGILGRSGQGRSTTHCSGTVCRNGQKSLYRSGKLRTVEHLQEGKPFAAWRTCLNPPIWLFQTKDFRLATCFSSLCLTP